ncbi:hypothetical protein ACFLUJ_02000 [Chloroflexota bacterium]
MSRFIDKLKRLSRTETQPMGFRTAQPVSTEHKMQLVASLAQESNESLIDYVAEADAGLLRISKLGSGAKALQKISEDVSDIPWGGWLQDGSVGEIKQMIKAGCDFLVFQAARTPLAILQNDEVGKILEVEISLSEGLLRAANELPIDAVLVKGEQSDGYSLTWQHLMTFQRLATLVTKPLLVSIPSRVTPGELQALWETGVDSVVVEVTVGQSKDRLRKIRRVIDKLVYPLPRRDERIKPMLPYISTATGTLITEEEEEE